MQPTSDLVSIFREGLALPDDVDVLALEYRAVPEWDSVGHLGLVALLEERFDIMLDTDQVIDMSSFQRAREILETHGVEFSDGD